MVSIRGLTAFFPHWRNSNHPAKATDHGEAGLPTTETDSARRRTGPQRRAVRCSNGARRVRGLPVSLLWGSLPDREGGPEATRNEAAVRLQKLPHYHLPVVETCRRALRREHPARPQSIRGASVRSPAGWSAPRCRECVGPCFLVFVLGTKGALTHCLSRAIIASDGFIEPGAAEQDSWLVEMPFVPPAVSMALLPPVSEEVSKTAVGAKRTAKALGTSRSEPPALEAFLQMNPEDKFDLEVVNSINLRAVLEQARGDKRLLHQVVRAAEALLPRVRAETEDPILVSGILRDKTLDWFRRSPTDRTWTETAPLRWGGMFHESRVPGGRLSRKLSIRLAGLIGQCVDAAGTMAFLRAGVTGLFRGSRMMAKAVQFSLA